MTLTYIQRKARTERLQGKKRIKQWYESPKFLKLRDKWYDKLEESGFDDVETRWKGIHLDFPPMYSSGYQLTQAARRAQEAGADEYFRRIASYLHEGTFTNKAERLIWALHVEGWSFSQIGAEIKRRGFKGSYSRSGCYRCVERIRKRME